MKTRNQGSTTRIASSPVGIAGIVALVAFLASCISQTRYDEARAESRFYQRMYQDLEPYVGELESENEIMRGRLAVFEENQPIEAVFTEDVDRRLDELRRIAAGLGSAPGDVTVLQVEGGYGYRLRDALLFDSGSAEIRSDGQDVLRKLAADISSRPYRRIWIRGHTDSDPVKKPETQKLFPHGNLQLSATRAVEVAALLSGEPGIDGSHLVVAGFGASEPVASNASAEGKQQNRRVEIFVIEDEEAAGEK